MTVSTDWSDFWLSADDWAEAFEAPDPGAAHNDAREQVWDELLRILMDKHDDEVPVDQLRKSLLQDDELRTTFNRAWPLVDATDLVADLWSVPAYLRKCAPWLRADEVEALQRRDAQAWTVSDLPFLDAARQRLGDPDGSRRRRRHAASVAARREQMAQVVDDLIAVADDEYGTGLVTMLRGEDFHDALVDEAGLPAATPDALAGPFAHVVVDEAQELTDAEWQMLLLRCPSRSFTVVGDRAQARHGFTESWQERLERVGLGQLQSGPFEHQLSDAGSGYGGGRAGHPGCPARRQRADVHPQDRRTRRPRSLFAIWARSCDLACGERRGDRVRHRRGSVIRVTTWSAVGRASVIDPRAFEGTRVRSCCPR